MHFLHQQQSAFAVPIHVSLQEALILVLTATGLLCGPEGLIMAFLSSACFRHSDPNDSCVMFVFAFVFNKRCLADKLYNPLGPTFQH